MSEADRPCIDPARTVELGGGWWAAWAVEPDGSSEAWLLHPDDDGHDSHLDGGGCCCSECAPHEQDDGRLPRTLRERVWGPLRCGRPRADGKPCRSLVDGPGEPCAWHHDTRRVPEQMTLPDDARREGP